jgi:AraC-like DNA-binding protein
MRYQKFSPVPSLRSFVECYFVWEGEAPEGLKVQSPPNAFSSMIFNYADPYIASQNNNPPMPVPRAFVSGQFTSNYTLELQGKIGMAGIVLKPSTLHNLFGIRMSELVNARVPISFFSGLPEEILWNAVKNQSSDEGRVKMLEELMVSYLPTAKMNVSIIEEAIDYIDECKGCVSVEVVADHLRISRRYLEKKFLEKVGVSPKFYARIKRFGILSNKIAHQEKIDWQEIVAEYQFHDQSHLVKEFMEFNQMNPSQYHQLHREMTRFVKL